MFNTMFDMRLIRVGGCNHLTTQGDFDCMTIYPGSWNGRNVFHNRVTGLEVSYVAESDCYGTRAVLSGGKTVHNGPGSREQFSRVSCHLAAGFAQLAECFLRELQITAAAWKHERSLG